MTDQLTEVDMVIDCETCGGEGTVDETLGGEFFSNPNATCPDCHGLGEVTLTRRVPCEQQQ